MNPWALITGATSGIGLELARRFAADRFGLVLVARNKARLNEVAAELQSRHGISTRVLAQDLAAPDAARKIFDAVSDLPITALVNNAGFGVYGPFAQNDLPAQTDLLQVNITAIVQLTHLFLQPMLARRAGRILNVASTAAFQPGPNLNCYYASKAFVYSFSYALATEVESAGVTVTCLCPGTTRTDFFARAKMRVADRVMMDARTVAEAGYRGMQKGQRVVIPGVANKLASFFAKRVPPSLTSAFVKRFHRQT